jgi:hypothetical protein
MEKFIFTFGIGQKHGGYCQPIFAKDYEAARNKMFELYENKWAFQYTNERWEEIKNNPNRMYAMETELEPIYAEDIKNQI